MGRATASAKAGAARRTATPTKPAAGAASGAASTPALALTDYPNPFGDELQLTLALSPTQNYTLAVYDAQGRLMQQLARG